MKLKKGRKMNLLPIREKFKYQISQRWWLKCTKSMLLQIKAQISDNTSQELFRRGDIRDFYLDRGDM